MCVVPTACAAYGVILVTTKQGEEGKMRASYQGTLGWSAPTVLPDMVNSLDFVKFWNDGVSNTGAANRMYSEQKMELWTTYGIPIRLSRLTVTLAELPVSQKCCCKVTWDSSNYSQPCQTHGKKVL